LEAKILKHKAVYKDPLFACFRAADRKRKVKMLEQQFFMNLGFVSASHGSHETRQP